MQANQKFWTKIAAKYAARPISNMQAYEQTLERIVSHLPADARVLELGCGTGGTAVRLAPHVGTFLATDFADGMIAEAHKRDVPGNVRFAVADVFDPSLDVGGYDAVIALNVVHLMEDAPKVHARVSELLAKDGLFISKTPCIGERDLGFKFGLMRRMIPLMQWLGKAPFVRLLSIVALEAEITEAGFRIVETGNYPVRPPSHLVVARKV
ncbi:MAG: methyltransferase domain-containing protein [Pseudomonadota bacterium]